MSKLQLIQSILLWDSQVNATSDLHASTISTTARVSTVSTTIYLPRITVSSVGTKYMSKITNSRTKDPQWKLNVQISPIGITLIANDTTCRIITDDTVPSGHNCY